MRAIRAIALICLFTGFGAGASFAQQKKVIDKKFWAVGAGLALATVYDYETTFSTLNNRNYKEGNPIMKPFVDRGRPAVYAVNGAINAAAMLAAYKLKKNHPKIWWVIPVCLAAGHVFAGTSNLRLARSR
ncbi:MAG: DUF5658 family protein [Patescibacteria group bacterium]